MDKKLAVKSAKNIGGIVMQYSKDIENMICVAKGVSGRFEHGPAPIPEEGQ